MSKENKQNNVSAVRKDVILKEFWRDNERFADLFNTFFFNGEKILSAESLQEMDTDVSGTIKVEGYNQSISRMRDVIKKSAYGIEFIICGIENQTLVHYAMPLRNMIYDSLGYLKEYQEISAEFKKDRKKNRKNSDGEFLSLMSKEDKLHPIITIVLYYGEDEWDGPLSLVDMMTDLPDEYKDIFSNYKMNLLQLCESGKFTFSNDEVETIFYVSRTIISGKIDTIIKDEKYRAISPELGIVIGKITDSDFLVEESKQSEEVVDMCTALEKFRNQGVEEGKREGLQEGQEIGKETGIKESLVKMGTRLLTKKFGQLTDEFKTKLEKQDIDTLEIIVDSILDVESLDEVEKYIK